MTLHILSAIIEKCPRDLSLYITAALRILQTVLQSNDITLVEYSVPAFETLCTYQEHASLTSEMGLLSQFEVLLHSYASYASKDSSLAAKNSSSLPLTVRYRKAGLQAIRGATPSVSTWATSEHLISLIMPVLLENVDSKDQHYINVLRDRIASRDEMEKDSFFKRKQSMSTVWTADTIEADPQAASGTIEDADKLAEEEIGILALQTLRVLFTAVNRGQLRWVTSAMLRYILKRTEVGDLQIGLEFEPVVTSAWPLHITELSCEWARVQDRFTILVTSVESLALLSAADDDLKKQLVLASLVESLLCSSINFIGLSVMDVLASLMQDMLLHIRKLETHRDDFMQSQSLLPEVANSSAAIAPSLGAHDGSRENGTLLLRAKVIGQLRKCVAGLATHVYYSDQISDMVSAILGRLKPSSVFASTGGSLAVQHPVPSNETFVNGGYAQEKPQEKTFPPGMGRFTALLAVKEILTVANTRILDGAYGAVSRSKVPIAVWEGTEWLLRDPHAKVRSVYVDSLLSWLDLELGKEALRLPEENIFGFKHGNGILDETKAPGLSRKALSTVLHQDGNLKRQRRRFLRSLHLTIYEIALQQAESEADILILHLLLAKMVEKLGVNALRDGLPMIMRLQEDIQIITSPKLKIQLGSLVYGYLQGVCLVFDIEYNSIGREIQNEVERRKEQSVWMEKISLPPQSLEQIQSLNERPLSDMETHSYGEAKNLKPFERREQLIDRISFAYSTMLAPPPSSPTGRMPTRSFSAQFGSASTPSIGFLGQAHQLPSKFREELLSVWTKEACLAHATHESSRSGSLNGSRKAANGNSRDLLAVAIPSSNVGFSLNSPALGDAQDRNINQNNYHNGGLLHSSSAYQRPSTTARHGRAGTISPYESDNRASGQSSSLQLSTSSFRSSVRVEDLKQALSKSSLSHSTHAHWQGNLYVHDIVEDTASESMVSAEMSASDTSAAGRTAISDVNTSVTARDNPPSTPKTPQTSHPSPFTAHGSSPPARAARELPSDLQKQPETSDDVPPVPPLPASLQAAMRASISAQNAVSAIDYQPVASEIANTGGASTVSYSGADAAVTGTHSSAATSVHKSKSSKRLRASSNPPGGSQRTAARSLASSADFSSLLESIQVEEDEQGKYGVADQAARRTILRPPH